MSCDDCEAKERNKALSYLTGVERRQYFHSLYPDVNNKKRAMETFVLGFRRAETGSIICHRCSTLIGSEGTLDDKNWNKFRDLTFCTKCVEFLREKKGEFCASCFGGYHLKSPRIYPAKPLHAFKLEGYADFFFLCKTCILGRGPRPGYLEIFLGGLNFLPDLLRPLKEVE